MQIEINPKQNLNMKKLLLVFIVLVASCTNNKQDNAPCIDLKVIAIKDTTVNYIRQFGFRCAIKNVSGMNLKAYRGILNVKDVFGESLGGFRIQDDRDIKNGESKTITFRYSYNPYDASQTKIITNTVDKLKFDWKPFNLILVNGKDSSVYRN
ncbi:hypothetical protein [uncultured Mucilaginibacter sp.]|uniref:hypothetical protein n=1 Tax=uncultured Mucilaginibacter sp. TaxID=797541 RepID=UPI0025F8E70E|nr:hypothetical protein [uncultured Mucilaginibacter sp.]